jgi:hypothetical protein
MMIDNDSQPPDKSPYPLWLQIAIGVGLLLLAALCVGYLDLYAPATM